MGFELGPRRGVYIDITKELQTGKAPLGSEEQKHQETFDLIYRSLCALLFNYVPMSGHPGGSISSGRFVQHVLFRTMDYDVSDPDRADADLISYAAGHKALGLYAMWALRNEIARIGAPQLLPKDARNQLRLEDLLGFRRNPVTDTPLFKKFHSKALDGHPTPATPFVRLSTGASGVGVASSLGLAYGAIDYYGKDAAPKVHVIEGEGGLTPGRVAETLAASGTASIGNAIVHVDWNQASIDSNHVCRTGDKPGDYVQWDPTELFFLHDWNVIAVPDGTDFQQIAAAQRKALKMGNDQPTAIVYTTTKGWRYGIEGRASHGAGHKLCTDGFFESVEPFLSGEKMELPKCAAGKHRCDGPDGAAVMEECFWDALLVIRKAMESHGEMVDALAAALVASRERLDRRARKPRKGAPDNEKAYELAASSVMERPASLALEPGSSATLRGELGKVLNHYNLATGGAFFSAAADLLGSTSVNLVAGGFPEGFYNAATNPEARLLSIGGICEDAMIGIMSGLGAYGRHIGAGSSYGAFIAPLGHIPARLHAIGMQAKREASGKPFHTLFLICAHAGIKTGEDGPTHADPQALQLLQENFPRGTMITLTPWDPQEMWYLVSAALAKRPAVIAPFVTRPNENILDRKALGLASASESVKGVYRLRAAKGKGDGVVVLQGSGAAYAFVEGALPLLEKDGVDLDVYHVSSAELFDLLPKEEQDRIFPEEAARKAMGITGLTLSTMYRWIRSDRGRAATLHPFQKGHFLGSGQAAMVLKEAGMDGESQYRAVKKYVGK
ncbi:MAG: hypothetical protein JW958_00225 [Candidatus Eisenbacteria bacterium]|nr:hypothetical protein [Candidatus Eisenbacteria bacterium]